MDSVVASIFCAQSHSAMFDASQVPSLADEHGLIHLFDDAEDDAPRIEWLVCLGGGESRATRVDLNLAFGPDLEAAHYGDDEDEEFETAARFEVRLPLAVA